ncbi:MAG: PilN domain-containing protein, partial [Wenzhouxiangella sp.]
LTIVGTTESETRVSEYMRRISDATWLRNPQLRIIEIESRESRADQPFRFELRAMIGPPSDAAEES